MALILDSDAVAALRERHEDVILRYSGRGMFGDQCLGYVGGDLLTFAFDLAMLTGGIDESEELSPGDMREELDNLGTPLADGYGMGTIWYWTRVSVAEDVAEEEGE